MQVLHSILTQNLLLILLIVVVLAGVLTYHVHIRRVRSKSLKKVQSLSDTKYLNLADLLPQMVFEVDHDGVFTFINSHGQEITGYNRIDIERGINIHDMITTADKEEFSEEFLYILEGGVNKGQEFRFLNKKGQTIPMIFYMSQVLTDNKVMGVRGIIIDVSDQKRLEQQLLTAIIDTEDRERKRFSEDLHDGLGPLLSTIKLYVNHMNRAGITADEQKEILQFTNDLLDESISNTKSIANNILPGSISDNGLVPTLNNTIKHAEANAVKVTLKVKDGNLELYYQDDGIGYDAHKIKKGLGLENIQSRARSIHASTSIISSPNEGFKYQLKMQTEQ